MRRFLSVTVHNSGVKSLEWQEVNDRTWRLIDPDAPQLRLLASHGQWVGYEYPKALAYVFDVGLADRDWRIRGASVATNGGHGAV
jgi:hypothetical protein